LPYATSASDGSAVPTNIYTIGLLLNISTSVITYVASIRIVKIDTQHTSMETRIDSEQMETILYDCIIGKAPCSLGNLNELKDSEGRTLLHWTAHLSLKEETKYLLMMGGDPNQKDDEGRTPLHYAVEDADIAELLIRHGANPNAKDKKGRTPLHYVNKREIAELFIRHGADVNARDEQGNTPLHTAISVVETLLSYGADPNIRNGRGLPPVYYAILNKECETAMMLLRVTDRNIIINTRDEYGNTLLHAAASSGCREATAELIKYIDVNAKNHDGNTPLHDALFSVASTEIIKLLINNDNIHIPNNAGITPLQLIASRCRKDYPCAEILELIQIDNAETLNVIVKSAFNVEQLKLLRLLLYNHNPLLLNILSQI
jgi:ankyrin repeat protein